MHTGIVWEFLIEEAYVKGSAPMFSSVGKFSVESNMQM